MNTMAHQMVPIIAQMQGGLCRRKTPSLRWVRSVVIARKKEAEQAKLGPDRVLPATSPVAVTLDGKVQLRMSESGQGALEPVSCYTSMRRQVESLPNHLALVDHDRKWTYEAYFTMLETVAKGFIQLGLEPHRTVGILGQNSPEWFSSAVGSVFAGGLFTGIYTTNVSDMVIFQLKHSQANIAVVDSVAQLNKILPRRNELPDLRAIVMYGEKCDEEGIISFDELLKIGQGVSDATLRKRLENQAVNQPAAVCYTSGTTDQPKGVLLSQDNITWSCASAVDTFNLKYGCETYLSYLPLSHIMAQLVDIWLLSNIGGTVYFADKDALRGTIFNYLAEIRPTRFVSVPRLYEKLHVELQKKINSSVIGHQMIQWARQVATEHYNSILSGGEGNPLKFSVADKLVLNRVHSKLGLNKCRNGLYSGAAPISMETKEFFKTLGIVVSEIYGLTECPNLTGSYFDLDNPKNNRIVLGSVGQNCAGCSTKLHLQDPTDGIGELAANSRNVFMGYLDDAQKTRETFDRGFWLLTGDMASLENDYYTIRGRIKDVIITSGGKNIAPYPIEERLKSMLPELVSNCVVVGNSRKFLSCLITVRAVVDPFTMEVTDMLDAEAWEWCSRLGYKPESVTDLVENLDKYPKIKEVIENAIDRINEVENSASHVQKFCLLPRDFSVAGGELGPTMKIKRNYIEKKYKDTIEALYKDTDRPCLWEE